MTQGMFTFVAWEFLNPELLIVGMIVALTGSNYLVALVAILSKGLALAPQILVSSRLEHFARRKPQWVIATIGNGVALVATVGAIWLLHARQADALSLTVFFICYSGVCLGFCAYHVIFTDMVGRLIPRTRTGSFYGDRMFLGGIFGGIAGLAVIQPIVQTVQMPLSNMILAAVGTVLFIVGMSIWGLCREEDGPRAETRTTLGETMRRGYGWLRTDYNYRLYVLQRAAFRIFYLGLAFFLPYGKARLTNVIVLVGYLIAIQKTATVISNLLWGRLSDRFGSRACWLGSGLAVFIAPLLLLAAPHLPAAYSVKLPGIDASMNLPLTVYALALASFSAGFFGSVIAAQRFVINNAPLHRRPSYLAFSNTITSPLCLLPLAGAWLAGVSMEALFAVVALGGLLSIVSALFMRPEKGQTG